MRAILLFLLLCPSVIAQDSLQDARKRLNDLLSYPVPEIVIDDPVAPQPVPPEPAPSITFQKVSKASGLVKHTIQVAGENYLVSEPWCKNCPPAKQRFLAAGNPVKNIISIAEAKSRFGLEVTGVPYEFSGPSSEKEILQPPSYRKQWPPKWDVTGVKLPSKQQLLSHLRDNKNHAGKHWQAWYLESWDRDQLAALHDDDHDGVVPVYEAEESILAESTARASTHNLLAAFSEALLYSSPEPVEATYGSLFDVDLDTPEILPSIIGCLMKDQKYDSPALGLSLSWTGERSFTVNPSSIQIKPAIKASVKRFGITASASVSEIRFNDDYTSVTVITPEVLVPDITINFK